MFLKIIHYTHGGFSPVPVPANRSRAKCDDNVVPVQEVSHLWGSTKLRGWITREGSYFLSFPMKIVLFSYDTRIVATLSLTYEDCRRPRSGSVSKIQNNSLPRRTSQRLWGGSLLFVEDFHCSGANSRSCLFLQSKKIRNIIEQGNEAGPDRYQGSYIPICSIPYILLKNCLKIVTREQDRKNYLFWRLPPNYHRTVTLSRRIDRYRFLILSVKKVPVDWALNRFA